MLIYNTKVQKELDDLIYGKSEGHEDELSVLLDDLEHQAKAFVELDQCTCDAAMDARLEVLKSLAWATVEFLDTCQYQFVKREASDA